MSYFAKYPRGYPRNSSIEELELPSRHSTPSIQIAKDDENKIPTVCGLSGLTWKISQTSPDAVIKSFAKFRYGVGDEEDCKTQLLSNQNFQRNKYDCSLEQTHHNRLCLGQSPATVIRNHADLVSREKSDQNYPGGTRFYMARQSDKGGHVVFILTQTRVLNDLYQMVSMITLYLDLSIELSTTVTIMLSQPKMSDILINKMVVTEESVIQISNKLKEFVATYSCDEKDCTNTKFTSSHMQNIGGAVFNAADNVGDGGVIILMSSFDVYPPSNELQLIRGKLSNMKIYFHKFVIGRGVNSGQNWLSELVQVKVVTCKTFVSKGT